MAPRPYFTRVCSKIYFSGQKIISENTFFFFLDCADEALTVTLTVSVHMLSFQEYIDGLGEGKVAPQSSRLKEFVDKMLQDVRLSYRVREEQLAAAVRSYKKSLHKVMEMHQALLTAYR